MNDDTFQATITVTTENLPAGVMAKTTGRIDTLFVTEKQKVKQGDLLALIENPADFRDVLALKNLPPRPLSASTPPKLEGNFPSSFSLLPYGLTKKSPHNLHGLFSIGRRPTLPPVMAVPLAQSGLTSLFGMGRGVPRRYYHRNLSILVRGCMTLTL